MREIIRLIDFYRILLLVGIIGSWIDPFRRNSIINTVRSLTDPFLNMFKIIIPIGHAAIDISPIVAIWILGFIQRILIKFFV